MRWILAAGLMGLLAGAAYGQSGTVLGPQGRYYYWQGGDRPVRISDGGTDSRDAPSARYRLGIPCRTCAADSISSAWRMTGSLVLPLTYWRDTSGVFTDDQDTTKKAKFQLSSIGTGATRWFAWPNRSGVVALETGATITGATIVSSSIDQSSIRVRDDQFWLKDNADTTKRAQFQVSGLSSGYTGTYSFPNSSGTIPLKEDANTWQADNDFLYGISTTHANVYDEAIGPSETEAVSLRARASTVRYQYLPDATGDLVLAALAQGLGSKTLYTTNTIAARDDRLTIGDDADTTKKIAFQASGIATGTTRTYAGPDASGTLALTTSTLSGTHSNGVLYDNLTWAKDANWTLKDDADTTKKLQLQVSGVTTGTTRTLTVPNVSGTLAVIGSNNSFSIGQTITASSAGNKPLTLKLAASATANALDVQNSGGTSLFAVGPDGSFNGVSYGNFQGYVAANDSVYVGSSLGVDPYLALSNAVGASQIIQANPTATSHVLTTPDQSGRLVVVRDSLNRAGQVASIGTTTWSTTPGAGMYQVNYTLASTAAAAAGTVTLTVGWTDEVGATTYTTSSLALTGTGRLTPAPLMIYLASGSITYATTVTGLIGTPAYTLRLRLVPLE